MLKTLFSFFEFIKHYVSRPMLKISLIGLTILMNSIFTVLNPKLLGFYVDYVLSGVSIPFDNENVLLYLFLLVSFTTLVLGTLISWYTEKIGWDATNRLRLELLNNILKKGRDFFVDHSPGETIERVDGDVQILSQFFSKFFASILGNGFLLLVIVLFLGTIHWAFSFAFLCLIVLTVVISSKGRKWVMQYFLKEREVSSVLYGTHEDLLAARDDLVGLGEETFQFDKAEHVESSKFAASLKTQLVARVFNIIVSLAVGMGSVIPFLVGVPLFDRGSITIGEIFLVTFYATMVFMPTFEIVRQMDVMQKAETSIQRINQLLTIEKMTYESTLDIPVDIQSIRFQNLSFQYKPDEPHALHGITGEFRKGQINGIAGRTGSGKTTLLRLLLRQYDPNDGTIFLNETEITAFRKEEYQSKFYWISQAGGFFPGSIIENMTFYDNDPNVNRITQLLKSFDLWQILERVNFDLQEDFTSLKLSEGEKQMFEFIRALYFDPQILILDEATSSTDIIFTNRILDHLEKIKGIKLIIVVAHHPETLRRLDTILHLESGKVVNPEMMDRWKKEEVVS